MEFLGYRRPDGKAGIRNKILILPASICATDTARIVAAQVSEAVTFHNQNGCSQVPSDMQLTMDTMAGMAANPNIYGTIVISLGCETCQMDLVVDEIRKRTNKPMEQFIIQENHGTIATAEKAIRAAKKMVQDASMQQKVNIPISELMIGTECGGSDQTSGLASNPLIGEMCDHFVDLGATAILSETTEFIGAEHILARRGRTPAVTERIYDIVHRYEKALQLVGEDVRDGNPSPGNMEGGLTTLEEKSLGCIHKGGHRPIEEVYDYSKPIDKHGLVIMDTPGNDPSSVAAMVAGGAQVVVFSTGRGTPTGNPIAPVIKITANQETYENMSDNIDLDVSRLIAHPELMHEVTAELVQEVMDTANGKLTKSETLGYQEMAIVMDTANGKLTKSETLGYQEMAIARVCNYV